MFEVWLFPSSGTWFHWSLHKTAVPILASKYFFSPLFKLLVNYDLISFLKSLLPETISSAFNVKNPNCCTNQVNRNVWISCLGPEKAFIFLKWGYKHLKLFGIIKWNNDIKCLIQSRCSEVMLNIHIQITTQYKFLCIHCYTHEHTNTYTLTPMIRVILSLSLKDDSSKLKE